MMNRAEFETVEELYRDLLERHFPESSGEAPSMNDLETWDRFDLALEAVLLTFGWTLEEFDQEKDRRELIDDGDEVAVIVHKTLNRNRN